MTTATEKNIILQELSTMNLESNWETWISNHPELEVSTDDSGNITKIQFPDGTISSEFCISNGVVLLLQYQVAGCEAVVFNASNPIYSFLDRVKKNYIVTV